MKHRSLFGLALALLATVVPSPAQNTAQEEVIAASTMIAFGRPAAAGELTDSRHTGKSLPELLKAHAENLKQDPALQRRIDERALVDAFGSDPLSAAATVSRP